MKMSKDHTTQLWHAVVDNNHASYHRINTRLLDAPTPLKHVPLRVYIPEGGPSPSSPSDSHGSPAAPTGSFRVLQAPVPAVARDSRRPQLLGQALKALMPDLFPSTRDPVLAGVVLHGAAVPFDAPLGELMREAAYPDGWVCLVVRV